MSYFIGIGGKIYLIEGPLLLFVGYPLKIEMGYKKPPKTPVSFPVLSLEQIKQTKENALKTELYND